MKITQIFINCCMDKQILLYQYNGILTFNKNQWATETWDESKKHSAEWKKPDTKKAHIVECHLHDILEEAKLIYGDRKIRNWGVSRGGGCLLTIKGYKGTSGSDTKFCILMIVVIQVYTFVKTQNTALEPRICFHHVYSKIQTWKWLSWRIRFILTVS